MKAHVRSKQINVRLTETELKTLQRIARRWGVSVGDAVRMLVRQAPETPFAKMLEVRS